jgi:hypothetical protein
MRLHNHCRICRPSPRRLGSSRLVRFLCIVHIASCQKSTQVTTLMDLTFCPPHLILMQASSLATAVGAELFAVPEKGATCSMCLRCCCLIHSRVQNCLEMMHPCWSPTVLHPCRDSEHGMRKADNMQGLLCCRVYMPQDYKSCNVTVTDPFCAGIDGPGKKPYITNVNQTWAWSAKIQQACSREDCVNGLYCETVPHRASVEMPVVRDCLFSVCRTRTASTSQLW